MKTSLTSLVLIVSFCGAGFLIFRDWRNPPRDEQMAARIDALAESHQAETLQEIALTFQAAQGALLAQDRSILQLPDMNNRSATQLKQRFSETLQIERQLMLIPTVSQKVKNIIVHTQGLLNSLRVQPDMQDFLLNNSSNDVKESVARAIAIFGDASDSEIVDATIRRSITLAILGDIKTAFRLGDYRRCIALCDLSIKHLQGTPMDEALNQIAEYRLRAQELEGWNVIRSTLLKANDTILNPAEIASLRNYIDEFDDIKFKLISPFFSKRFTQARRVLGWQQLLQKHQLEDAFARKSVSWVTGDTVSIGVPILELNDFYQKNPETPEAGRAEEIATNLLIQHFQTALAPLTENQKRVELVLRRTGSKHEGIIETDTEHRTTLKPQYTPKENNQSHFFTAAIQDEPRLVDDYLQEEQYREQFRATQAAATQDTWSRTTYTDFASQMTGIKEKRAQRQSVLEEISRLVDKCKTFDEATKAIPNVNNK